MIVGRMSTAIFVAETVRKIRLVPFLPSQSYGHQRDGGQVVALHNLWRGIFSDQSNVLQQDQRDEADLFALKLLISKDENVFFLPVL